MIGEWDMPLAQAVTALAVHPTCRSIAIVGLAHGGLLELDMRESDASRIASTQGAGDAIVKIRANGRRTVSFFAGTKKGALLRWETLTAVKVHREVAPMSDFDVHPSDPMYVVSPASAHQIICDLAGEGDTHSEEPGARECLRVSSTAPESRVRNQRWRHRLMRDAAE